MSEPVAVSAEGDVAAAQIRGERKRKMAMSLKKIDDGDDVTVARRCWWRETWLLSASRGDMVWGVALVDVSVKGRLEFWGLQAEKGGRRRFEIF